MNGLSVVLSAAQVHGMDAVRVRVRFPLDLLCRLLNTLYYTCTFLFVWLFVLHVPQGTSSRAASMHAALAA